MQFFFLLFVITTTIIRISTIGKTATVLACIRNIRQEIEDLRKSNAQANHPDFEFVEINCLHMSKPVDAYSVLWKALSGEHLSAKTALSRLQSYFQNRIERSSSTSSSTCVSDGGLVVCLLDELDYLVTQNEQVVYNFFNWPQHPHAGIIIIGIANTMDLPERLSARSLSRLGLNSLNRIVFKAYTFEQMYIILLERIKELKIFELKALELTARKAASSAGDLRSALKICQRCVTDLRLNDSTDMFLVYIKIYLQQSYRDT